ncbi:hypothetical protein G7085_01860 [Tessaracoccus sp. HDW20]|uniref:hypothetical protein n=1 Tax=Tessaracoccus coleopterorum TaxID=2714950 RepID=UPI0018D40B63|nr:hypothetical protein [Tessaracoccus coleopterorum]NHB83853.1 hypothetical protein [Tessaracoccus coleopterorum]
MPTLNVDGSPPPVPRQVVGMSSRLGPALAELPMFSRLGTREVVAPHSQGGLSSNIDARCASKRWPAPQARS